MYPALGCISRHPFPSWSFVARSCTNKPGCLVTHVSFLLLLVFLAHCRTIYRVLLLHFSSFVVVVSHPCGHGTYLLPLLHLDLLDLSCLFRSFVVFSHDWMASVPLRSLF